MAWEHCEDLWKSGAKELITAAQWDVWLLIAQRINPRQGFAWPHREEICSETRRAKATVDRAVSVLTRFGLLRTHRRGFDRLNFSIPDIAELSRAVAAIFRYYARAEEEHGVRSLYKKQAATLRMIAEDSRLQPQLLPDGEKLDHDPIGKAGDIGSGIQLGKQETLDQGSNVAGGEVGSRSNSNWITIQSLLWTKEKEKEKGEEMKKTDVSPTKEKTEVLPENATHLWQLCLRELEETLPQTTYHTWVHNTSVAGAEADRIIIAAPTEYARDWLQARLTTPAKRILQQFTGREIDIAFTTEERAHDRAQTETLQRVQAEQGPQPILQEPVAERRPAVQMQGVLQRL